MRLIRTKGRGTKVAAKTLAALEQRGGAALDTVLPAVKRIVADVRKRGDRALLGYAAEFDGLSGPSALRVAPEEMAAAWKALDPASRDALRTAAAQIRGFAKRQMPKSWMSKSGKGAPLRGLKTGQLVRPLGSVGCYVPSGRHPLPSTLLMTAIPAQVAGVGRIVVVSPKPAPETLAAAHLLGVTEFFRLGGAHAVAALAYGTATLPRVCFMPKTRRFVLNSSARSFTGSASSFAKARWKRSKAKKFRPRKTSLKDFWPNFGRLRNSSLIATSSG